MHQLNMKIQGFYSVDYIRDVLQKDENVKIVLISTLLNFFLNFHFFYCKE